MTIYDKIFLKNGFELNIILSKHTKRKAPESL